MKMNFSFAGLSICVAAISTVALVACGGGGSASSTGGTSNPFVAELINNTGLRAFDAGYASLAIAPMSWVDAAIANPDGTYTLSVAKKYLSNGAWVSLTLPVQDYYLSATGIWKSASAMNSLALSANSNGTISWNDASLGPISATPVAVDLSGANMTTGKDMPLTLPSGTVNVKVGAISPMDASGYSVSASGVVPTSAVYPAGSTEWVLNGIIIGQDVYEIFSLANNKVSTQAGNLTAISMATVTTFTTANPLCFANMKLVSASTISVDTARFDVYSATSPTCAAIASGATKISTIDLTFATVRTQPIAQISNYSIAGTHYPFVQVYPAGIETAFLAAVNGTVYWGIKIPANFSLDDTSLTKKYGLKNKVAMDAVMTAAGLPVF